MNRRIEEEFFFDKNIYLKNKKLKLKIEVKILRKNIHLSTSFFCFCTDECKGAGTGLSFEITRCTRFSILNVRIGRRSREYTFPILLTS